MQENLWRRIKTTKLLVKENIGCTQAVWRRHKREEGYGRHRMNSLEGCPYGEGNYQSKNERVHLSGKQRYMRG